jgi:hypothetical protein
MSKRYGVWNAASKLAESRVLSLLGARWSGVIGERVRLGLVKGRTRGEKVEMRVINSFEEFHCEEEQRNGEVPEGNMRSRKV